MTLEEERNFSKSNTRGGEWENRSYPEKKPISQTGSERKKQDCKTLHQVKTKVAKSLCSFINSKRLSGAHLVDEVFLHVLSVFGVRISHEPKALDAGVLNRMATGVEMYGDRFVPVVDDVCQVFLESGFQGAARLTNVEFGTLGTVDHVDEVVCFDN